MPVILGSVVTLPFLILEAVNRGGFHDAFPVVLFVVMWLLSLSFFVVLMPVARSLGVKEAREAAPFALLPRLAVSLLVAGVWISLVLDQMPCFLGVPNCD